MLLIDSTSRPSAPRFLAILSPGKAAAHTIAKLNPAMHHWLFKSEPDAFSIERLEREGKTEWSGVRNYQARNFMREMRVGDLGFFYHSNSKPPGIVGICRVVQTAYPDFTAFDPKSPYFDAASTTAAPRWEMVDVAFVERFTRLLSLDELRAEEALAEMPLVRKGQRLSVQPVTPAQWRHIVKLARRRPA